MKLDSLTAEQTSILAIKALDDLVIELVDANRLSMAPTFFDWVADSATPVVEAMVSRSLKLPRFTASLELGDPRKTIDTWVRHWTLPMVRQNFAGLVTSG
ncbi:MAG: hypothetical protein JWQ72_1028 [Polaromonas sp.]|nr:hypothetical protein [Polaromonas sp.]